MAASDGDLLRCTDVQTFLGQTILNVYFYEIVSIVGVADGYLEQANDEFVTKVITPVTQVQSNQLLHTQREWRNLTNGVDLFVDSSPIPGIRTSSNVMNSFTSLGFQLVRGSLLTRNGYKRFAGLTEDMVDGNTVTFPTTTREDIEDGLVASLNAGLVPFAEPVIVKRPIPDPAVGYVRSSIISATFRQLGTQNTRKAGRGI